jgi:hypothetical protein
MGKRKPNAHLSEHSALQTPGHLVAQGEIPCYSDILEFFVLVLSV